MKILLFVGVLYLLSGSLCALNSKDTAAFLGLELVNEFGLVEYMTVYGGLQIGLGLAMLLSGFRKAYLEGALFFVLVFSAVLASFRVVTMSVISANAELIILAILEWGITLVVGVAWCRERAKSSL